MPDYAKTGQNVDQLFESVIEILIERYPDSQKVKKSLNFLIGIL